MPVRYASGVPSGFYVYFQRFTSEPGTCFTRSVRISDCFPRLPQTTHQRNLAFSVAWCDPPIAACVKNSDIIVAAPPQGLGRPRPRSMAEFVTLRATGPGRGGADTAPAVASPHPETTQSACNLQGGRGDLASGAGANRLFDSERRALAAAPASRQNRAAAHGG